MKGWVVSTLAFFTMTAFAGPLTPQEKHDEFTALATLIRASYGPYELKSKTLKVDLNEMVDRYSKVAAKATNLEFYYLVNRFVAEFRDSHFGTRIKTDHVAKLGFVADRIENKALIDEIDRKQIPEASFPFQKGDEIVTFGGKPTEEVVKELGTYLGSGNPETNLRSATQLLGFRNNAAVPPQRGKVELTIRRGTSNLIEKATLEWKQTGAELLEDVPPAAWYGPQRPMDYLDLSVRAFDVLPRTEKSFRCSGETRVAIPSDATHIIDKPFVAYYHPTPKGNVGYLRIPHYSWTGAGGKSENDLRLKQYEYAVDRLERNTVALVIDQDHNCGGSVALVENMVSLFANKPFPGLQFQFLATRGEYLLFKSWLDEESELTLEGAGFTEVLGLMKKTWLKGDRMTPKTTFSGGLLKQPNPIHYTHPVLVLADEMSGSGGDAFPAMMQGYGFAKLMGSRTMGAGGHVEEFAPLNYSANTLRMTKSLFYHPNGTPIENNGASPDVGYKPTRDDFLYGYKNYQQKYLEEVLKRVP